MYQITTATKRIAGLTKRIRAIQGGTSASKTVSILLYLIHLCQQDTTLGPLYPYRANAGAGGDIKTGTPPPRMPDLVLEKKGGIPPPPPAFSNSSTQKIPHDYSPLPTLTSVVSESFPHLKRGAIRDFLLIMDEHKYFDPARWNKTDYTYTFETGSKIEFFSADQAGKVRGPRRDRLFINEVNNISFETFEQLEVRTKDFVYLDWNPTNEFWFYTDMKGQRKDIDHIILTYKDNEALGASIVDSIEQRRNRKGWWQVYGEGQLGEVEGKIYRDWMIIDDIPHEARLERYGLDFGYTNDPTAIVAIYRYDGGYILDEVTYHKGLANKQIADTLQNQPQGLVIADSAEPKSIDEIKAHGINILPAEKGKDSVSNGIQLVQDQRISMTKHSVHLIKEYRNYLWETDKEGKILNVPEKGYGHCMDAVRYALTSLLKKPNYNMPPQSAPIKPYYPEIGF